MTVKRGYRFAAIPEWVLFHSTLEPIDVRVFGALDRHADKDGRCWPGLASIARDVKSSEATVRRSIRRLQTAGAVAVRGRADEEGRQRSNEYRLAADRPLTESPAEASDSEVQDPDDDVQGGGCTDARAVGQMGGDPCTDAGGTLAPVLPEREPLEREPVSQSSSETYARGDPGCDDDETDLEISQAFELVMDRLWVKFGKGVENERAWRAVTEPDALGRVEDWFVEHPTGTAVECVEELEPPPQPKAKPPSQPRPDEATQRARDAIDERNAKLRAGVACQACNGEGLVNVGKNGASAFVQCEACRGRKVPA